jgi:hypothetical protein
MNHLKSAVSAVIGILILFSTVTSAAENPSLSVTLIETRKIWGNAPHNAFTDLIRFRDRWFCAFREGETHASPDGKLRIITSTDGVKWESSAVFSSSTSDLRDAKLSTTPENQLMLSGAETLHDKSDHVHQSLAWFSADGSKWTRRYEIGDPDFWLWRVTWHRETAYSFAYGCGKKRGTRLYSCRDGRTFGIRAELSIDAYFPNEASVLFKGDTAYCLMRCDGRPNTAKFGISEAPYTKWKWKDTGIYVGGPQMILLPDGRVLGAGRLLDGDPCTALFLIDTSTGKTSRILKLPSGGDTGYPGMIIIGDRLWVSYYSSHEGKTSIYLSQLLITPQRNESSGR